MTGACSDAAGTLIMLATEMEAADQIQQSKLLCDTWDLLAKPGSADADQSSRFMRCIEAEAFESAAIMLVPEESLFTVRNVWNGDKTAALATVIPYKVDADRRRLWMAKQQGFATTPALAVAAACLRARALRDSVHLG